MSSYMVEFSTMDAVLTFRNRMDPQARHDRDLTQEGRKLLELNALAVEGRYAHGKGHADYDQWFKTNAELAGDYVFTPRTEADPVLWKSLCCWLYQCSEDPAYKTETFKTWDALADRYRARFEAEADAMCAPWGLDLFGQDEPWTPAAEQAKWAKIQAENRK